MGSKSGEQTTTVSPWKPASRAVTPAITALRDTAFDRTQTGTDAFGRPVYEYGLKVPDYVGPGELSQDAMARLMARAGNDPLQQGAESYFQNVLSGAQNPYLERMYDQAAGKVRSKLDSQFAAAGRYGGSDHEIAMGGALGDLATNLYGGQYQSDMSRMMTAAQIAPSIGYAGDERALRVGQMADEQARVERDWNYDQSMQRLQQYLSMTQPLLGAGSTTSTPVSRSPIAGALGGFGAIGSLMGEGGALAGLAGTAAAPWALGLGALAGAAG